VPADHTLTQDATGTLAYLRFEAYCYSVGIDASGDAIATALISCGGGVAAGLNATGSPPAAAPPGPVHQCGTFVSYTPATPTLSGSLVIGTTTYATSTGREVKRCRIADQGRYVSMDSTPKVRLKRAR
jgi:hypothetical protein